MISTITRQDLQGALDNTRNRIIERQLTRGDAQLMLGHFNDHIIQSLTSLHYENQEILKFTARQTEEIRKRLDLVETTLTSMEKSLKV